mgnify:CR=1 FL=1
MRMPQLPLDPEEWPGTPEHDELMQERRLRRQAAQWAAYEDDHDRRYLRH